MHPFQIMSRLRYPLVRVWIELAFVISSIAPFPFSRPAIGSHFKIPLDVASAATAYFMHRTLSHNLCFCAKKTSADADMLHQDECEAPPPYYPITAYTTPQDGTATCGTFERGGPISCFLACQCSFVLITPAAAAVSPVFPSL